MSRRISVARCLVLALGISLAAPAALAGGHGIDLSGSIAGSYFYNASDSNGPNTAAGGNPFHPSSNEFQLDQAVLDLQRAKTDESKLGFRVRTTLGELGDLLGNGNAPGNGNGIWLADAYIDYSSSFLGGLDVQLGKFQTHIGYETAFADENANVLRGTIFNNLQPFDQIGLRLSKNIAGLDVMIGAVNGVLPDQPDSDTSVDLVWSLGYSTDKMSISFNGEWDAQDNGNPKALILDGIIEVMPSDSLVAWIDITYVNGLDQPGTNPNALGIALGSRLGLTDKMGIAGRFEWMNVDDGFGALGGGLADDDYITLTGTVDYMLVENLVAKLEVKWDHTDDTNPFDGGTDRKSVV